MYNREFDLETKGLFSHLAEEAKVNPKAVATVIFKDFPSRDNWLERMEHSELKEETIREIKDYWLNAGCSEETANLVAWAYTDLAYELYQVLEREGFHD
jgi:hypothetical protein